MLSMFLTKVRDEIQGVRYTLMLSNTVTKLFLIPSLSFKRVIYRVSPNLSKSKETIILIVKQTFFVLMYPTYWRYSS